MTTALLGAALLLLVGEDCNGNGVDDALDLRPGAIGFVDPLPARVRFPPGSEPVIVDINGDGRLDMVLLGGGGVTVSLSDGPGDLLAGQQLPVGSGPRAMISADVDADGDPDIVTANGLPSGEPGNVSVFHNAGGTLDTPRNFLGIRFPLALADANDDGRLDITDPIAILEWLFLGGSPPLPPGPPGERCGPDPPGNTLGCEAHGACRGV